MPKRSRKYQDSLAERLKDSSYALAYLSAAWEDSDQVFLLALRDVATSVGIAAVAERAGVNRENLYRGLSEKGNPTYSTFRSVIRALGVSFGPIPAAHVAAAGTSSIDSSNAYASVYESIEAKVPAAWLTQELIETDQSLYYTAQE